MTEKNTEEIEEVKDFLQINKTRKELEMVSIIFDGKQYSIRIPKRFADAMEIDTKKDIFEFELTLPPPDSKVEPSLKGELMRKLK